MAVLDYTPAPIVGEFLQHYLPNELFYSFIVGPFGPVSGDTEFLTEHGWKRIDAYTRGDLVAQWKPSPDGDQTAGLLSFIEPSEYIVTPATEMIYFRNEHSLSMVLSEKHRVPYYDYRGVLQESPAGQVEARPSVRTIPTAFIPAGRPGLGMPESLVRLAVAINADGH